MYYVLSESEFDQLNKKVESARRLPTESELQKFCIRVADEMPVQWMWGDGKDKPKPWGCILTKKGGWYCDQCPAQKLCPHQFKEWSK